MYTIATKTTLADGIYSMEIEARRMARAAQPGQFLIAIAEPRGERVPLTICDTDPARGTVRVVFQVAGRSTRRMAAMEPGQALAEFAGPLGRSSDFTRHTPAQIAATRYLLVGGGVGAAPVYPQAKWLAQNGGDVEAIIAARSASSLIMEEEFRQLGIPLHTATDDGTRGHHGNATQLIEELVLRQGRRYGHIIAIGPMPMMKHVSALGQRLGIPTTVSMNSLMVCGAGMCGACRCTVDGQTRFACHDGPEFDGHKVDFDEAHRRQGMYRREEQDDSYKLADTALRPGAQRPAGEPAPGHRVAMREQDPAQRARNFAEVTLGYDDTEARAEARRCLDCKNPRCVTQCPVGVDIPGFIRHLKSGDNAQAARALYATTSLPAVCGRVCPQETQCEQACVLAAKGQPVAIGRLERYTGDWARDNNAIPQRAPQERQPERVAVIGSGPAGLTCAAELAAMGYGVKIFESFHRAGGVLEYGIPEFRLPKEKVVRPEIDNLRRLGVEIETGVVVGRATTIEQLTRDEGYQAVFIGTGAGLPNFMGIDGENLNGVLSANEFLTRANLMKAYLRGYETPIRAGRRVAVVGGGNVAMDAARTALRLGAEVTIVYRRGEEELPARREEVEHAKEEGARFAMLTNPLEILDDGRGWVAGMRCARMELGEPDQSGRRAPRPVPGSEHVVDCDTVIMSLGTSPNPLLASTTPQLDVDRRSRVVADADGRTNLPGVFAGGDVVTGAATVILAMGAGKRAAKAIDQHLRGQRQRP